MEIKMKVKELTEDKTRDRRRFEKKEKALRSESWGE